MKLLFRHKNIVILLCLLQTWLMSSCERTSPENIASTINVRVENTYLPVYVRGNLASGKLIILLHGGPGGNGLEYRAGSWAKKLEESYAVAYLDQRGQGMAQGKFAPEEVTIDKLTADLYAVVRTLQSVYSEQSPKIYLLGHSWGGMLGTAYLLNPSYAATISGWIESNGAHDIPMLNKAAISLFKKEAAEQIQIGNSVQEWQEILDWANGIDVSQPISSELSGEINDNGFKVERILTNDGVIRQGEGMSSFLKHLFFSPLNPLTSGISGSRTASLLDAEIEKTALTSQLYRISTPTLLLYSRYDFVVPLELGNTALKALGARQKRLVTFTQSGHSPMDTEAEQFVMEIRNFIETN